MQTLVAYGFYCAVLVVGMLWQSHGSIAQPVAVLLMVMVGRMVAATFAAVLAPLALNTVAKACLCRRASHPSHHRQMLLAQHSATCFETELRRIDQAEAGDVSDEHAWLEWRGARVLWVRVLLPAASTAAMLAAACIAAGIDPVAFALSFP